jgi:hypothetical protein
MIFAIWSRFKIVKTELSLLAHQDDFLDFPTSLSSGRLVLSPTLVAISEIEMVSEIPNLRLSELGGTSSGVRCKGIAL